MNEYKNDKYALRLKDIEGTKVSLIPFEIGLRGYLTAENVKRVKNYKHLAKRVLALRNWKKHQFNSDYSSILPIPKPQQ